MNTAKKGHPRRQARLVHMHSTNGHREEYQNLFARSFNLIPSIGKVNRHNFLKLITAEALFFGTIDDDYIGFLTISLARASVGRRTVGLFLRPQTCFNSRGLKFKLKKSMFKILKSVSFISVFTIVPFSVAPQYQLIAVGGVVDPQMWDVNNSVEKTFDSDLTLRIQRAAYGRRVIAFIGTASEGKGIEFLCDLLCAKNWPSETLLPVIAGKFPSRVRHIAQELSKQGALVIDRHISNQELYTIYDRANLIWSCYRPDYDQASGIFGRAIQLGKVPVVRSGSMISHFARKNSLTTIELEYGSVECVSRLYTELELSRDAPSEVILNWKYDFEETIRRAL